MNNAFSLCLTLYGIRMLPWELIFSTDKFDFLNTMELQHFTVPEALEMDPESDPWTQFRYMFVSLHLNHSIT